MPDALALIANAAGKLTREGLRITGRGATALPGLVALTVDPDFITALTSSLPHGVVCISGTNGKTTTARMLAIEVRARAVVNRVPARGPQRVGEHPRGRRLSVRFRGVDCPVPR